MARIQNPKTFSRHFGLDPKLLDDAGFIDPYVDVDIPLFIDPVLLAKSSNDVIARQSTERFRRHFSEFLRLLAISEKVGDVAWRAAASRLDLREPPENGLGYGGSGKSGSSRSRDIQKAIMETCQEVMKLGIKDPEMVSLMGFFEEDVGPDTISDFTTRVVGEDLAQITNDFCREHGIDTFQNPISDDYELPSVPNGRGGKSPIILVPKDIVRDLPIASDWSEVENAAMQNAAIRERVNRLLGGIAKPTVAERKAAIREAALSSEASFEYFLASVKEYVREYDPNIDMFSYYRMRDILHNGGYPLEIKRESSLSEGPEQLHRFVLETIDGFRHHVENGNLWEELWIGNKPKVERSPQLLYFAIADVYCKAHNIDISPEASMGGGPVDFKFSKGYDARVLVEMKRDTGTLKHGYEKQLEIYKNAARTEYGIFVIMDYGRLTSAKLKQVTDIRSWRLSRGERASDIIVIDASRKKSASKR